MSIVMIAALLFAVFSLGQALFAMARGPDESGAVAKALTRRIAVSVGLFVLIVISWKLGWIEPNGTHH